MVQPCIGGSWVSANPQSHKKRNHHATGRPGNSLEHVFVLFLAIGHLHPPSCSANGHVSTSAEPDGLVSALHVFSDCHIAKEPTNLAGSIHHKHPTVQFDIQHSSDFTQESGLSAAGRTKNEKRSPSLSGRAMQLLVMLRATALLCK